MGFGRTFKSAAHQRLNGDGSRQKTGRPAAAHRFAQELFRLLFKILQRQVHGLEHGLAGPDKRAKGDKPDVPVKFLLAGRAGNDAQIVAVFQAVLPHQGRQPRKTWLLRNSFSTESRRISQMRRPGGK